MDSGDNQNSMPHTDTSQTERNDQSGRPGLDLLGDTQDTKTPATDIHSDIVTEPQTEHALTDHCTVDANNGTTKHNQDTLRDLYDAVQYSGRYNYAGLRRRIPSGLNIEAWRKYLTDYTDVQIVDYLEYGWPVNFDRSQPLTPSQSNHYSAQAYPDHVDHYIATELGHEALLGPFEGPPITSLHTSPLMTREKRDSSKRRVIVDLSFPMGYSINDGIHPTTYIDGPLTVRLPTVQSMEQRIVSIGRGAFLYKTDLARGYRQLRIDPMDWGLLGFQHRGQFYIDICPPFGLRSSAMMMVRTTTAIIHIHKDKGYDSMAYIDDFGGAEHDLDTADLALATLQSILKDLGMAEAESKICPPTQIMTWLGIQFDTLHMTMSLPPKKRDEVAACLRNWEDRTRATLREVQSLFGLLQFVTSVAPAARLFTNRILDTIREVGNDKYVTLSWGFKRDVKFFRDLLPDFRGVKIMDKPDTPAQHSLELDACLVGCGGVSGTEFYGRTFPPDVIAQDHPIAHLELLNIVVAVKLWSEEWAGHKVRITCDNMNAVLAVHTGRTRDPYMQHCAREIHLFCARHDIELLISHAPGTHMVRADALSHEHLGGACSDIVAKDPLLRKGVRIYPEDNLFRLINEL